MRFDIITIFPDIFDSYIQKGMLRIAQKKKLIKIKTHDLRKYAVDKHGTVDDKPYGGGPGQIMMVEPVCKAINKIRKDNSRIVSYFKSKNNSRIVSKKAIAIHELSTKKSKIVLLSARGKRWNQQLAKRFSKLEQITFVCPRYEGHDERIKKFVDEEISIGDYVLTGGELGALVIMDSITRLIPGVLGKKESLKDESHSKPGYLEYPQYTRPEIFEYKTNSKDNSRIVSPLKDKDDARIVSHKLIVPKVLLSGHHKKIQGWRNKHAKIKKG